jgi:hypothetical protein
LASVPDAPGLRRETALAYGFGALVVAGLAHFLYDLPIQVTDSYGNMLWLESSWRELMVSRFGQEAFLRPFLWAELKAIYDLSGGNYYWWFRSVHVLQVLVLVVFYLLLVRPRTWIDAAVLPLGLGVLVGMHTFTGTIIEAFPINTFLTILLCCFGAALIALGPHRWWSDVVAVLLFWVAALTVESGLLVWVIFIGAALVGARGVSRAGLAALVVMLASYFVLRFALLGVGGPGLDERASGYGFSMLERADLMERFGANPLPFYAYNVAASFLSVLLSEPRAGIFALSSSISAGAPDISLIVAAIASVAVTAAIVRFAWRRRHAWIARRFEHDDRLVLLFAMVLTANAVISYPYTKDVIMSPAGAFLALAAYVAVRHAVMTGPSRPALVAPVVAVALGATLSATWAVRVSTAYITLRGTAFDARNEWAHVDEWLEDRGVPREGRPAALAQQLRDDAIMRRPPPPSIRVPYPFLFEQ